MEDGQKKRIVKEIHVDVDKCTGCRACELACSAFHAMPKYSATNPAKARIRVIVDECNDVFVPIRAGYFTAAECAGRCAYTIHGKSYAECGFCKVACPSRVYFFDPDSGLPLKCDMCETDLPLEAPMCVQVCRSDALTYTEREEAGDEAESQEELDLRLESLVKKHGLKKVAKMVDRIIKTGKTFRE
ncbi:MAG: (4Fe-4S)-binding protein [Desulfobacteraceae bacterium]